MADDSMTMGYLMGQGENKNSGGFMGGLGEGLWAIIILAMLGFGGGYGFGGGFGGGAGLQGIATRADINEGFALQNITGGIQGIQQGICDATYGLTGTITGGFNSLSAQLAQCCCDNRAATADLKYAISSEFCGLGNTIQSGLRDVIDNQNANYRGIMDFLVQEKLSSKDARIAELTNQVSQSNQNAVIGARIDAAVAELLRRTGNDCPTAAYLVQPPTPVNFPVNGCGQVQFGGYGYGGCGC